MIECLFSNLINRRMHYQSLIFFQYHTSIVKHLAIQALKGEGLSSFVFLLLIFQATVAILLLTTQGFALCAGQFCLIKMLSAITYNMFTQSAVQQPLILYYNRILLQLQLPIRPHLVLAQLCRQINRRLIQRFNSSVVILRRNTRTANPVIKVRE